MCYVSRARPFFPPPLTSSRTNSPQTILYQTAHMGRCQTEVIRRQMEDKPTSSLGTIRHRMAHRVTYTTKILRTSQTPQACPFQHHSRVQALGLQYLLVNLERLQVPQVSPRVGLHLLAACPLRQLRLPKTQPRHRLRHWPTPRGSLPQRPIFHPCTRQQATIPMGHRLTLPQVRLYWRQARVERQ